MDRGELLQAAHPAKRRCQTNANSSQSPYPRLASGTKEAAPLLESGGTVRFEIFSRVEPAFLVEVIVNRAVDGCELLQTSHLAEAQHRPLSPSERQVRVLGTVVDPSPHFTVISAAKIFQSGPI